MLDAVGISRSNLEKRFNEDTDPIWNEDGTFYENFAVNYYYNPVGIIREQDGKYIFIKFLV